MVFVTDATQTPLSTINLQSSINNPKVPIRQESISNLPSAPPLEREASCNPLTLTTPTAPSQGHSQGQRLEPSNNGQTPHSDPDPPNSQGQLRVTPECTSDAGFQDPDPDFSKKVTNFGEGNEQYHQTKTNELNKTEKELHPEAQPTVETNDGVSSDHSPPQNKENFQGRQGHTHPKPSHNAGSDVTLKVTPTDPEHKIIGWDDLIQSIDEQIERLGWSTEFAQQYIIKTYGKRSRQLLSDDQLIEFHHYLKNLDTPFQCGEHLTILKPEYQGMIGELINIVYHKASHTFWCDVRLENNLIIEGINQNFLQKP